MSRFLLDTNVLSEFVRTRPEPKALDWIADRELESLFVSVVSLGELRKGITMMAPSRRRFDLERWLETALTVQFTGRILPVTRSVAETWGRLEAHRHQVGRPLSVPDGQIAATAIESELLLVTRNVSDFEGLGVEIVNPWD
ncbi:MAG: type II toxin-antitoxin system VapC family toxin [Bryobacterales bacterium]|nr:type II toxin-antitoxin system VapC family toxin [Bryobacterales bacterium]